MAVTELATRLPKPNRCEQKMVLSKLLVMGLLIPILILAVAVSTQSSIQEAKASIIGAYSNGYDAGKAQAKADFPGNYNDSCPGQGTSYCTGWHIGYNAAWVELKGLQP